MIKYFRAVNTFFTASGGIIHDRATSKKDKNDLSI